MLSGLMVRLKLVALVSSTHLYAGGDPELSTAPTYSTGPNTESPDIKFTTNDSRSVPRVLLAFDICSHDIQLCEASLRTVAVRVATVICGAQRSAVCTGRSKARVRVRLGPVSPK
jgi:hypothetical protein